MQDRYGHGHGATMAWLLVCAVAFAATGGGCKKKDAPAAPSAPKVEAAAPADPLATALSTAAVTLPRVAGAPTVSSPVSTGEDGAPRYSKPLVTLSGRGIDVDGKQVIALRCDDGPASCKALDGDPHLALRPLNGALTGRGDVVLATDAAMPYEVFAFATGATLGPKDQATLLARGDDDALGGVLVEASAGLRWPRVVPSLEASPIAEELLPQLRAAGIHPRGAGEPPVAPGYLVRVTTGPLAVPDMCGGVEANKLLRRSMARLRGCYRLAVSRKPDVSGEVDLTFSVPKNGRPTGITASRNTTDDDALSGCLVQELEAVHLPRNESPEPCKVTWTLKMRTEEQALEEPHPHPTQEITARPREAQLIVTVRSDGLHLQRGDDSRTVGTGEEDRSAVIAAFAGGKTTAELTAARRTDAGSVVEAAAALHAAGIEEVVLTTPVEEP